MNKLITAVLGFFFITNAFAITCKEIQELEGKENFFLEEKYTTTNDSPWNLMLSQVKEAITRSGEENSSSVTLEGLDIYDPIFLVYVLGSTRYQAVNLSLGDNPFIYLFNEETSTFSGIESLDGSLYVNGIYCQINSEI